MTRGLRSVYILLLLCPFKITFQSTKLCFLNLIYNGAKAIYSEENTSVKRVPFNLEPPKNEKSLSKIYGKF